MVAFDRAAWDEWIEELIVQPPLPEPERPKPIRTGERPPISRELRRAVRSRDGNRCLKCHWSPDVTPDPVRHLEVDHIIAWSAGGPHSSDNLRTLCNLCNAERSNWATDLWYTRTPLPVVLYCYPCRMPADRREDAISVYCGNCERPSWTIAAYPPL